MKKCVESGFFGGPWYQVSILEVRRDDFFWALVFHASPGVEFW